MSDYAEFEFVLRDGSKRYEIMDLSIPIGGQMFAFMRLHGAVSARPLEESDCLPT